VVAPVVSEKVENNILTLSDKTDSSISSASLLRPIRFLRAVIAFAMYHPPPRAIMRFVWTPYDE